MRRRCYETEHERLDPTTDNVYHFDGGGDWIMRGATIWQSFGKPKVEEIAEKNSKPKRKIGFSID